MRRSAYFRPISICFIALLLVVARAADAHVHLSFHGTEPPASVHLGDARVHGCEQSDPKRHCEDKDVSIGADALLKKAGSADQWYLPPANTFKILPAVEGGEQPEIRAASFTVAERSHLRPPLRGPPL